LLPHLAGKVGKGQGSSAFGLGQADGAPLITALLHWQFKGDLS
jgi:hypothetical protein